MGKKVKILLAIVCLIIIGFFAVRYYVYHGGERNIQKEEAAFTVSSSVIVGEFTNDVDKANKKYLEKPVAVSGKVSSVEGQGVILDNSVNCNFSKPDVSIKVGQSVTVKGRVIGFDDLLGELKLDQCSISK